MQRIDLNCDLGEGAAGEAELMALVTSANIACGGHAGDETTMRASVELALRHGVGIGAHPGYADREHFGRRERAVTASEVRGLVLAQTRALQVIAHAQHAVLGHVKPHGALYNQAARDPVLAGAVVDAVAELDAGLVLFAPAGSVLLTAALEKGLPVASEVFADRSYQPDGSLTPRTRPEALIMDERAAVAQVLRLVREGKVRAVDGTEVALSADTVCVHGDGPHALALVRALRRELELAGIALHGLDRF
jgi:5-oxoprolinase (ATP-hydrolysing) subunit A